jgi:Holliday junction resolvase
MTGRASKRKGSNFERDIVNAAKAVGLNAKRAYASNGLSLGQHEEVDVLLEGYKIQAKRRKHIGELVKPNENVDIQVIKEDRGHIYAVMRYEEFLNLLLRRNETNTTTDREG